MIRVICLNPGSIEVDQVARESVQSSLQKQGDITHIKDKQKITKCSINNTSEDNKHPEPAKSKCVSVNCVCYLEADTLYKTLHSSSLKKSEFPNFTLHNLCSFSFLV